MTTHAIARVSVLAGLVFALAACGGGGSGVAGIPAPPATITNYSYARVVDLPSESHQLTASFLRTGEGLSDPRLFPVGQGLTISYDKVSGSYSLSSAIDGMSGLFAASERSTTTGINHESYVHVDDGKHSVFSLSRGPGVLLTYTMFGTWHDVDDVTGAATGRFFVTGSPTKPDDLPTGSATYAMKTTGTATDLAGTAGYDLATQSSVTMTVDFRAGQVSTSLALVGTPAAGGGTVDLGTYSGTSAITAATASYSGLLSGSRGSGGFAGGFFGPKAAETGYVWSIQGDTFNAIGNASGGKD